MGTIEKIEFEYTNSCTCQDYDPDTDEYSDSLECYGDCYSYTLEDFQEITSELFQQNDSLWWKIENFRLWNGEHSGYVYAENSRQLLERMTVDSHWIMRGTVYKDFIFYSLSHHDVPMGSATTVVPLTEQEVEELGLYQ
jgi:hypothetical protein